jgi:Domain of unknown function (DUF1844)
MPEGDAPKLIIDSDWKSQAQAEKERLSETVKPKGVPAGSARPSVSAGPSGAAASPGESPEEEREIGFQDLLSLLITQALTYMGGFPDPRTGKAMIAIDLARVYIDMLGVLEQKTKGNLSEQEAALLSRSLNELRLEWVEVSKAIEKAIQEGRIQPQAMGGVGGVGVVPTGVMQAPPGAMGGMGNDPNFKLKF